MAKTICICVCPLKAFRGATAPESSLKVLSNVMDWILPVNHFPCKQILNDDPDYMYYRICHFLNTSLDILLSEANLFLIYYWVQYHSKTINTVTLRQKGVLV